MKPGQQLAAPAHASVYVRLSLRDHAPIAHGILLGCVFLFCALSKGCMNQHKERAGTHKKRTRWAVSEIYLEFELAMINCLKNAISLLTIMPTEYLVVVIEELLRCTYESRGKHLGIEIALPVFGQLYHSPLRPPTPCPTHLSTRP